MIIKIPLEILLSVFIASPGCFDITLPNYTGAEMLS
ncbi:hypothetical protein ES703_117305 [subsurface metagenome]